MAMLRLLRFMLRKPRLSLPFSLKPIALRVWSPVSGGSILMTSAPMSPSNIEQNGPAITWLTSRTRTPLSGSPELDDADGGDRRSGRRGMAVPNFCIFDFAYIAKVVVEGKFCGFAD